MQQGKTAFIFPGQGESHSVGMCQDFYNAYPVVREMFDQACTVLGYDIKDLIFNGPHEKLSETEYCQAAIYLVSVSVLTVLKEQFPEVKADYCAGLSLGEYSAATAAGVISFEQGMRLIQARGRYMQKACQDHPSTMAVVLGLTEEQVVAVLQELNRPHEIWLANLNCPGQIVVSGTHEAIEAFIPLAKEAKAKRVLPLNVAGAFHCPLMGMAAEKLTELIEQMELKEPSATLMMNVTGDQETDVQTIKQNLIKQITHPVRWQAAIQKMEEQGVETFIEIGCGKVLSGLNKRMGLAQKTISVNSTQDLEALKEKLLAAK